MIFLKNWLKESFTGSRNPFRFALALAGSTVSVKQMRGFVATVLNKSNLSTFTLTLDPPLI